MFAESCVMMMSIMTMIILQIVFLAQVSNQTKTEKLLTINTSINQISLIAHLAGKLMTLSDPRIKPSCTAHHVETLLE